LESSTIKKKKIFSQMAMVMVQPTKCQKECSPVCLSERQWGIERERERNTEKRERDFVIMSLVTKTYLYYCFSRVTWFKPLFGNLELIGYYLHPRVSRINLSASLGGCTKISNVSTSLFICSTVFQWHTLRCTGHEPHTKQDNLIKNKGLVKHVFVGKKL
jgi:hypothetical protein